MYRRNFLKIIGNTLVAIITIPSLPITLYSNKRNKNNLFSNLNWFEINKIQAHIRLPIKMLNGKKPKLFTMGNIFLKNLGVNVITRHFKSAGEGSWWKSKLGEVYPLITKLNENIAETIVKDAHNQGLYIIAYYRHMENEYINKKHPAWLCKNWKGKNIKTLTNRGYYICFNSPYREFLKQKLIELVQLGVDGIYFDETHMPRTGCWCKYCQEKFKSEYKHDVPKKVDFSNPIWAKYYTEFTNKTIEETFLYWKESIKKENPNVKFIISLHLYPTLYDYFLSTKLMRIADSVKSEFDIPIKIPKDNKKYIFNPLNLRIDNEIKMAFSYTLIRDASASLPAHIWIPQAIDKTILEYATAGVISYANIANINIVEQWLNTKHGVFYNHIGIMNKKLQTIFNNMIPIKSIGIYYSERQRNSYIPNYGQSYEKVIRPILEAYEFLFLKNLPVSIYTDETIATINSETEILFVPRTYQINKDDKINLNTFTSNGVIIVNEINQLKKNIEKLLFPFEIMSTKKCHISYFNSILYNEVYIFIANEFSWISEVQWKKWGQYLKKRFTYKLPSNIDINIKIKKDRLPNIKKIEEVLNNKIDLKEDLEFIHINIKDISSLAVLKIQKIEGFK